MEFVFYAMCLIIGIAIGIIICSIHSVIGTLIVDKSDEKTDRYRIEIDNLDIIQRKKKVILKIKTSQK